MQVISRFSSAIVLSSGSAGYPVAAAVAALALLCASCGHSPPVVLAFRTEQQAQEHCPDDTVVWLDPLTASYHLKSSGSYGRNAGRYACRGEADRAGMQAMPD
jgi:hypothetical protein